MVSPGLLLSPMFWFQPIFYAAHGWLATEMAIWLMFHPYNPIYIPGTHLKLPLTPGIFHKGKDKLTHAIADAVTQNLLTPKDIQAQIDSLLGEENIAQCLDTLLASIEKDIKRPDQIRQLYRYGDEVLPALVKKLAEGLLENVEHDQRSPYRKLAADTLHQLLPHVKIPYDKAELIVNVLFDTLMTPAAIRDMLSEGLEPRNLSQVETQIPGWTGFIVNLVGLDKLTIPLRNFISEHPDTVDAQILQILDRAEVRERLAFRISNFRFAELPEETQQAAVDYIISLSREMLGDYRDEVAGSMESISRQISRAVIRGVLRTNLRAWVNIHHPHTKYQSARLIRRYLDRELPYLIQQGMAAINLNRMITEKLSQISARELESLVYGICRRELRWLAFLGGFLGFWLGMLSNVAWFWWKPAF